MKILSDNRTLRWITLFLVAFAMMTGYFVYDVMSPLETMLENDLGWTSSEYGFFSGSYAFLNVYLLMMFVGGMALDRLGIRITGTTATTLMVLGAFVKFAALQWVSPDATTVVHLPFFGLDGPVKHQVMLAAFGFSIFGVGSEVTGFTVSKCMVKWFTGHELALAMGIQVAMARLGTASALAISKPFAQHFGTPSASVMLGVLLLVIGLIGFLVYSIFDRKLDQQVEAEATDESEKFHFGDLKKILGDAGFWHLTLICLFFYSAVNPFLKFAARMMVTKYGVADDIAGTIVAIVPFGAILLTPIFGHLYDRLRRGTAFILAGATLLTAVHLLFALPIHLGPWFPGVAMILFSIAFSLLPSALWPSVPKIIPQVRLGTAYASIFWLQNMGRAMIPILIGSLLDRATLQATDTTQSVDPATAFLTPMLIFACFGALTILVALSLHRLDRRKGYGIG